MARWIDADAMLDRIPNLYERRAVARWTDEAPAADVAPVRRGRWIKQSDRTKSLYGWNICSECGAVLGSVAPYCSECGAQMVDNETAFNRWAKSVADSYRKDGGDGDDQP